MFLELRNKLKKSKRSLMMLEPKMKKQPIQQL